MHIYFDLDDTLIDGTGYSLRPGINRLLAELVSDGHILSVWTASTEERTKVILDRFDLGVFFSNVICREHYDPYSDGYNKDIRYLDGDMLVDDDPEHIKYVHSIGRLGFLISPYSTAITVDKTELEELRWAIRQAMERNE